jgi:MGT family glycosyltransferase
MRSFSPDVVVADPMLYAAAIAASITGTPWAALSTSLNPATPREWRADLVDTLASLEHKRAALFRERSVPVPRFFVSDAESPWLNLAFTVPAYADAANAGNERAFSIGAPFDADDVVTRDGPVPASIAAHIDLAASSDRPLWYASFGSQAFHQPHLFAAIFRAATPSSAQVIASVGDLVDDEAFAEAARAAGACIARSIPQLALLAHGSVAVTISHGGANSVVESLAHDIPLVLLPLCNDQPLQARFLLHSGAGVVVDIESASAAHVERAVADVMAPRVRERAAALGAALRAAGGPGRAADLIEQLARTRRAVLP